MGKPADRPPSTGTSPEIPRYIWALILLAYLAAGLTASAAPLFGSHQELGGAGPDVWDANVGTTRAVGSVALLLNCAAWAVALGRAETAETRVRGAFVLAGLVAVPAWFVFALFMWSPY